jgi:hypothetical protein
MLDFGILMDSAFVLWRLVLQGDGRSGGLRYEVAGASSASTSM